MWHGKLMKPQDLRIFLFPELSIGCNATRSGSASQSEEGKSDKVVPLQRYSRMRDLLQNAYDSRNYVLAVNG
jgi:hypothetical protein